MMMIYHWRRGAEKHRGDSTPEAWEWIIWLRGSQVAISAMLERGGKRSQKNREGGCEKKKVVPQLEANCYLPCMCKGLFHSLSLFPSPSLPLFFLSMLCAWELSADSVSWSLVSHR